VRSQLACTAHVVRSAVPGAHAMIPDGAPVIAAADRPLIDVLLVGVPGIELRPIGAELLADREARPHPAAAAVVIHRGEPAAFNPALSLW
jgi:hypothetical protein